MLLLGFFWTLKNIPLFRKETENLTNNQNNLPLLSIIVPACNEAENIETAIQSLIDQDYPNLEIIAINDRSTDETGNILERLAKNESRLQVLNVNDLPAGWLGKVNALNQGTKIAKGDWLLFTDADVHFNQGLLKRAIYFVKKEKIDHLVLMPIVFSKKFWLDVCITTFGFLFIISTRAILVNQKNSKTPIGIGAFNMVSKEIYNRTPGFEWLRLEPADDYGLGLMVNNAGGRSHFALAEHDLSVPWYGSVKEMFRGLEKNLFGSGAHYSLARLVIMVPVFWSIAAAPGVALVAGLLIPSWIMVTLAGIAIGVLIIISISSFKMKRSEALYLLLFPLGLIMISFMFLWAGYRCLKNNGINWRGTHYTLKELRAGQRVKF
ncbi:MAG: glycosyltransferase family 2 protein [Acidiferrobacterales bacterium]